MAYVVVDQKQNHLLIHDIVAETHFTNKSYIKIPYYNIYHTKHPDGTAHRGTAIIIRNKLKHHELKEHSQKHLQASTKILNDRLETLMLSAVYCPP